MEIDSSVNANLRRQYNPDGSMLRQAQMRMLKMLEFIDNVCSTHDIEYWIESGTLLGAVRHGGFIPWDDDADVCMPITDFLRFKEIMLKGNCKDYSLQCHETDENYYGTWVVLRDLHSEMNNNTTRLGGFKFTGLQVDIFPIDDRCNKTLWKVSRLFFAYLVDAPLFEGRMTRFLRWNVPNAYFFLTKCVIPFFRWITPPSKTISFYRYGMFWYRKYPKSIIYPLKKIEFEGKRMYAPNDVDRYLTLCYGNWREIPSEGKRQTHHFNIIFK